MINKPHDPSQLYIPARPTGHPSVRGRPKGSVNAKPIVERIAFEKHKTKDRKGNTIKLTTLAAIIRILQHEAMAGNHRAAAIRDRYFGSYVEPEVIDGEEYGVLLAPAGMSAEQWIEEQKHKNARMDALMKEIEREETGKP